MGLIKCKDCEKEYSEHLKSCPNCGCPSTLNVLGTTNFLEVLEEIKDEKGNLVGYSTFEDCVAGFEFNRLYKYKMNKSSLIDDYFEFGVNFASDDQNVLTFSGTDNYDEFVLGYCIDLKTKNITFVLLKNILDGNSEIDMEENVVYYCEFNERLLNFLVNTMRNNEDFNLDFSNFYSMFSNADEVAFKYISTHAVIFAPPYNSGSRMRIVEYQPSKNMNLVSRDEYLNSFSEKQLHYECDPDEYDIFVKRLRCIATALKLK